MVENIQTITEKLTPVFKTYGVRKAILFGSYAKGCAVEESDVDLMVDSGLRGLDFVGLLGEVCDNMDKQVDLIDTAQIIKGSKIENEINDTGVVIYER
ncbi:MAG: nucleotidyltransferase domain-containing protein [Oscillospiraceae bacterium]|nr:nucleotidyltransferase domain-containing protein [Oscillospiraceae bacterium]